MWNLVYSGDSRHSISSWELAWTLNCSIRGLFHIYPWILETHLSQQFLSHYLACKLLEGKVCILRHQFSLNWLWTEKVGTWCLIGMVIKYAAQARNPDAGMVKGKWSRAGSAWPEPWRWIGVGQGRALQTEQQLISSRRWRSHSALVWHGRILGCERFGQRWVGK